MALFIRKNRATRSARQAKRAKAIRQVGDLLKMELARLSLTRADYRIAVPFWYPGNVHHEGEILWCKELNAYIKLLRDYRGDTPPKAGDCELLMMAHRSFA